jgi:hypothetical protein
MRCQKPSSAEWSVVAPAAGDEIPGLFIEVPAWVTNVCPATIDPRFDETIQGFYPMRANIVGHPTSPTHVLDDGRVPDALQLVEARVSRRHFLPANLQPAIGKAIDVDQLACQAAGAVSTDLSLQCFRRSNGYNAIR